VKDQYRHCKPILVLGVAASLLDEAHVPSGLPSGEPDSGILQFPGDQSDAALQAFVEALTKHRHFERETDPPTV
jgi:catalase